MAEDDAEPELSTDPGSGDEVIALREAVERLTESMQRHQLLADNVTDVVIIASLDGHIEWISSAVNRMLGWQPSELIGHVLMDLVHPDDTSQIQREGETLDRSGVTAFQARLREAGGGYRWMQHRGRLVYDSDGRPTQLVGSWRDIESEHAARALLRASEEHYRLLVDNTTDVLMLIGLNRVIQWISSSCRTTLGVEPEDVVGRPTADWIHPDDYAATRTSIESAIAAGLDTKNNLRLRMTDGSYRWFEAVGRTATTTGDHSTMRIVRVRDIDAEHNALTALAVSQEELRAAAAHKDAFIRSLSHELRNPLSTVENALWLLEQLPADSAQAAQVLGTARRQASQLAHLVDDLLDVTRLAQNKITLEAREVDLIGLLRRVQADAAPHFTDKGIEFHVSLPDEPLLLSADPVRLTQAIDNLLHNAAKFTEPGGSVRSTLDVDTDSAEVVITIRDDGHGIDPHDLPHIFEAFSQAQTAPGGTRGGLGLGLAIVSNIVALHGGSVTATSPGLEQGAEFQIRLPLRAAPPPEGAED